MCVCVCRDVCACVGSMWGWFHLQIMSFGKCLQPFLGIRNKSQFQGAGNHQEKVEEKRQCSPQASETSKWVGPACVVSQSMNLTTGHSSPPDQSRKRSAKCPLSDEIWTKVDWRLSFPCKVPSNDLCIVCKAAKPKPNVVASRKNCNTTQLLQLLSTCPNLFPLGCFCD